MAKVTVEFDCSNAAFEDYHDEAERILRYAADRIGGLKADAQAKDVRDADAPLFDTNGNRVGFVTYHHKEE